jgi:hypothetical protein
LRDAIVIRPVAGSAQFLDSESTLSDAIVVVGTMAALRRIFSPVDPRLLGPAVGSELGWEASANMSKEFLVDGGGRRVIETLNQIAVQTPGAWQVTTRLAEGAPQIIAFGFVYRDRARGMVTLVDTGAR